MPFISDNFLLSTAAAQRLYRSHAAALPICDFHNHLPARDIASDRRFTNLAEAWLEGDHYKWRAMRANGVPERYCTGDAPPYEKFLAWARTVPQTLRNPLYHWTHLELSRYFGIVELLDEQSAPSIWQRANQFLQSADFSARGILKKFNVTLVGTTDDPADSLEDHLRIRDSGFATRVLPGFRPDNALRLQQPLEFNRWVERLAAVSKIRIRRFSDFLRALESRHDFFHEHGCRLSDHGLERCPVGPCTESEAAKVFDLSHRGKSPSAAAAERFSGFMMLFLGRLDAEKGWTKQLHLGAYRNANSRMLSLLGRDTGFDAMGDFPQVIALAQYLDRLDCKNQLPKMIVYNLNPADNYAFASLIGSFQDGSSAGKIQLGSAWWFLDNKEGIEAQLNALSNCGLLSRFVGMVTDSRSFLSFPRHEYFRRVLCNLLGAEIEFGVLPDDEALISGMIHAACYGNASGLFESFPAASSIPAAKSKRKK